VLLKVFYRDFITRSLHQVNTDVVPTVEKINEALTFVAEDLDEMKELYHKPILGLVQGGCA
jgi:hypothetical protein